MAVFQIPAVKDTCVYLQNDVGEWMQVLGMSQYCDVLVQQGYNSIDSVTDIMWEDLEEIGIKKLGQSQYFRI